MEIGTRPLGVLEKPVRQPVAKLILNEQTPCVPQTFYSTVLKRVVDLVVSVVLIAGILSWLIPVLFVLVKLSSRGPLFFIQKRIGRGGQGFSCIKFRTMRVNDSSHEQQAEADDGRITRIGHLLRITHIDELPQLINVLFNQMSLVGPRPHMLYHDSLFTGILPNYPFRHLVKPGITGLAQAWGYYGSTPDFFSISCRTRLDLFYVRHVSPGLDLKIFLNTLLIVPAKLIGPTT